MKVQIIKCHNPNWWYSDKIGEVYKVGTNAYCTENDYVALDISDKNIDFFINKSDCVLIEN